MRVLDCDCRRRIGLGRFTLAIGEIRASRGGPGHKPHPGLFARPWLGQAVKREDVSYRPDTAKARRAVEL